MSTHSDYHDLHLLPEAAVPPVPPPLLPPATRPLPQLLPTILLVHATAGYRETLGDDALYDGFEAFLDERGWKAAQVGAAANMRGTLRH